MWWVGFFLLAVFGLLGWALLHTRGLRDWQAATRSEGPA
jgi:hypothetical protein